MRSTLPIVREKKIDALGRAYGTGKRKSAIARVWIKPGKGIITVNERLASEYLASTVHEMVITQPFDATNTKGTFDVICTVKGGGLSGQAGAIRHGIARALQAFNPEHRIKMKPLGLLTRDARRVERKKFGHRKARRSFQFSKR
ncbi:MAG: 30S ribosomal protein S9 [Alphaproteobacteria bacterium]|nr:30S ribosomal protein S9 [Alphaproteobacteria bacterium]